MNHSIDFCLKAILTGVLLVILFIFFPAQTYGQIKNVSQLTAHPVQRERVDFTILLMARWTNSPYRAEEVRLDLRLISPSGTRLAVPAFYEQGESGTLSVWKVRFTPAETGKYRGDVLLTDSDQTNASAKLSFKVAPSNHKGFLHAADDWTFRFDIGEPFRGIGENICWESRSHDDSRFFRSLNEDPRFNYNYLLARLHNNGGNFFRTWMCPWNLPLEWKTVSNTNRYADDAHYFNNSAIQRLDELINLADSLGLYIMLTLDNSGDFQGRSWSRSNYNKDNGGPDAEPEDFFINPNARARYKDRLRYLVARWGYSPHIAAWEFFNEIDNLMYGLPQKIPDSVITAWHTEMSQYLKSIDPYHHAVTTSISHRQVEGLYGVASMDFNQIHIYGHNGQSRTATFPKVIRQNSSRFNKPFVIGEYGFEWDWSRNFDDFATNMDDDFKKGLWLGLFSPTPILPMSWWWEYFDDRNVTPYVARVRSILDKMLAAGNGSFADVDCKWDGAPAQVMGVRCGNTLFVLLINDKATSAAGNLSLPLKSLEECQIDVFDPAINNLKNLTVPAPPVTSLNGISIPPASQLVLIISPKKEEL